MHVLGVGLVHSGGCLDDRSGKATNAPAVADDFKELNVIGTVNDL